MSQNQFVVTTGLTSNTAAAHTAIEITPGGPPVTVKQIGVSSSYLTTGTPITCLVELGTFTTTGTGTTATFNKWNAGAGTVQSSGKINDSAEPTGFSAVYGVELVFPAGPWEPIQFPLGVEPVFTGKFAIRLTPSATASFITNLVIEE